MRLDHSLKSLDRAESLPMLTACRLLLLMIREPNDLNS